MRVLVIPMRVPRSVRVHMSPRANPTMLTAIQNDRKGASDGVSNVDKKWRISDRMKQRQWEQAKCTRKLEGWELGEGMGVGTELGNSIRFPATQCTPTLTCAKLADFHIGRGFPATQCPYRWVNRPDARQRNYAARDRDRFAKRTSETITAYGRATVSIASGITGTRSLVHYHSACLIVCCRRNRPAELRRRKRIAFCVFR